MRILAQQRQLAVDIIAAGLDRCALRAPCAGLLDGGVFLAAQLLQCGQVGIQSGALLDELRQIGMPARLLAQLVAGVLDLALQLLACGD